MAANPSERPVLARLVELPADRSDPVRQALLSELGQKIKGGRLVSFPTETVYGLGANGLDAEAVLSIYKAKGRPLTDPVICHVAKAEDAHALLELLPIERRALDVLAGRFWPGPLSVIGKAAQQVPPVVTASTGFVAVRCPNNAVALDLIKAAGVPIAAPSANLFGHISPTSSAHVFKDFMDQPIDIIQGTAGAHCHVGIESTVARIERIEGGVADGEPPFRVCVLRRGAVSREMLEEALQQSGDAVLARACVYVSPKIQYTLNPAARGANGHTHSDTQPRSTSSLPPATPDAQPADHAHTHAPAHTAVPPNGHASAASAAAYAEATSGEAYVSPGMLLTHYAPSVPTFLAHTHVPPAFHGEVHGAIAGLGGALRASECVLIDFGGQLGGHGFVHTLSLTESTSSSSTSSSATTDKDELVRRAAANLFGTLHSAEEAAQRVGARAIVVCWFDAQGMGEGAMAVYDRLYRSASGRFLELVQQQGGWELQEPLCQQQ